MRANWMIGTGEFNVAQENGDLPTMLVAGSAPGESGISLASLRFDGGMHLSATLQHHLIVFQTAPHARFECRMADRMLAHVPPLESLAICPAGIDCAADAQGSVDAILVAVDPDRLVLSAAEKSAAEARLIERLSGSDEHLLALARTLASESSDGYPNGPSYWNAAADNFIDGLVAHHTSGLETRPRGMLSKDVLKRLRDYIVAHLDEPIEVATLVKLAGRSPFHFSRVFTRSVGISPHRYIVHLRLQHAISLVRDGRSSLAEIAARTGFADQSHLSRWAKRVYGVPLTRLAT
jgi:AraC family transcriptional regulator